MNILLLGKPGTGKGTQGKLLEKQYHLNNIIAGDILRKEKSSDSSLGKKIASIIDQGNLVPDEMINEMIVSQLEKEAIYLLKTGYLFDGYPRTVGQAKFLDELFQEIQDSNKENMIVSQLDLVVNLTAPDEVLINRILERGKSSNRKDDQSESIIKTRLKNYQKLTQPLLKYYQDKVVNVDSNRPIEEVNKSIKSEMIRKVQEKVSKNN